MSNPNSMLEPVSTQGFTVQRVGEQGMVTLRATLNDPTVQQAVASVTGAAFPAKGKVGGDAKGGLCWMSPDELLLLMPYDATQNACQTLTNALKDQHHLAVNVSDARAMFTVSGAGVRDMVAKLTPVDLHPNSLAIGDMRRTKLGQVAAAFWLTDATTVQVVCFRSVADYMADLLATSAAAGPVNFLPNT